MHLLIVDLSQIFLEYKNDRKRLNINYTRLVEDIDPDVAVAFSQVDPHYESQKNFLKIMRGIFDEVRSVSIYLRPSPETAPLGCVTEIAHYLGGQDYDQLTLVCKADLLVPSIVNTGKPTKILNVGAFDDTFWGRFATQKRLTIEPLETRKYRNVRPITAADM